MARIEREYAEALYLLANESGSVEDYLENLLLIRSLLEENPLYLRFLSSPAVSLAERRASILEAFEKTVKEHVLSFLLLLCDNGRVSLLPECIKEYEAIARERSGRCEAVVTSAIELEDEQKARLTEKLNQLTGKTVEPIYRIDESVLGGLKIEVDAKTYDGTLLRRLRDVKDVMSQ